MDRLTKKREYDIRDEGLVYEAWNRLAELEDKLERGELVEIVRCKDCKRKVPTGEYDFMFCTSDKMNHYCSYGVKK